MPRGRGVRSRSGWDESASRRHAAYRPGGVVAAARLDAAPAIGAGAAVVRRRRSGRRLGCADRRSDHGHGGPAIGVPRPVDRGVGRRAPTWRDPRRPSTTTRARRARRRPTPLSALCSSGRRRHAPRTRHRGTRWSPTSDVHRRSWPCSRRLRSDDTLRERVTDADRSTPFQSAAGPSCRRACSARSPQTPRRTSREFEATRAPCSGAASMPAATTSGPRPGCAGRSRAVRARARTSRPRVSSLGAKSRQLVRGSPAAGRRPAACRRGAERVEEAYRRGVRPAGRSPRAARGPPPPARSRRRR